MAWQVTPYIIPIILVALISVASAIYIWRHHRIPAAKTLALILLASTVYVVCHILEFLFISESAIIAYFFTNRFT